MTRRFITVLCLLIALLARAQDHASYLEIVKAEDQLKALFDRMYNEQVLGTHRETFREVDSIFHAALLLPGSFDHQWGRLEMIGHLVSDDQQLKVFSWMYMVNRDEYHYSGFIQYLDRKGEPVVVRLQPAGGEERYSEEFDQDLDQWHGKVYYKILTNKHKRKTFYTLLGADFKDTNSSMKTIEVLTIQRGQPVFRDDQFLADGTVKDRVVLEYSADLTMSLNYNEDLDMIVCDHLNPLHPIYHGHYAFYGPDGSYDGYTFTEGVWVLEEDVDARNNR